MTKIIAITGKVGTGKTVIADLLIKLLSKNGLMSAILQESPLQLKVGEIAEGLHL